MLMADTSVIVRKMRVYADRCMNGGTIGFPERLILMFLKAHGSSNQEAIAEELQVDKGSIARTISKLEEKELVSREVNPNNKREKLVSLLPKAEEEFESMQDSYQQLEGIMFEGLSEEDIAITSNCLAQIAANLSKALKEQHL